jgi:hypothetical protein
MSSQNTILLKAFNKHLFEFIDETIKVFPNNKDLIKSREYLDTLKKGNPTIIIKIWNQKVNTLYKKEIDDGNIEYFLNKDYREDLGENQVGKDILNVFENSFRKPMKDLDENSKQAFLKYFQLLSNLSEKYSS